MRQTSPLNPLSTVTLDHRWQYVGYLRLRCTNGQVLEVGRAQEGDAYMEHADHGRILTRALPLERHVGKLAIVGVATSNANVTGFQVVNLGACASPEDAVAFITYGLGSVTLARPFAAAVSLLPPAPATFVLPPAPAAAARRPRLEPFAHCAGPNPCAGGCGRHHPAAPVPC